MTRTVDVNNDCKNKFSEKHPIVNLILLEAFASALCLCISYLAFRFIGINIGTTLFFLMIAVIPLALDKNNVKSSMQLSRENLTSQSEVHLNKYKESPYIMLKYGTLGLILLILSGYFGMI